MNLPSSILFLHQVLALVVSANQELQRGKFKAAVYEHAVFLPEDPKLVVSRRDALELMRKNLDVFAEQAAKAKEQVR